MIATPLLLIAQSKPTYHFLLKVIQDGRNQTTNKMVASVKWLWVLATTLDVDLRVG